MNFNFSQLSPFFIFYLTMQRFAGAEGVELRWVGTMPERTISASWRDSYYWDAALMDYLVMGREVSATG